MPIINEKGWEKTVKANDNPYGKTCVDVARRAMEILDSEIWDIDCYGLIYLASRDVKAGGIIGYMAGAVASMISKFHSRGEEFRLQWNESHSVNEEKAKGGIVNPAVIIVEE